VKKDTFVPSVQEPEPESTPGDAAGAVFLLVWCERRAFPREFAGSGCERASSSCGVEERLQRWGEEESGEIVLLSFDQLPKKQKRKHCSGASERNRRCL